MSQITPKPKSKISLALQSLLRDPQFVERLERIYQAIKNKEDGISAPSEADKIAKKLGLGQLGSSAFRQYFVDGSLERLRERLGLSLAPVILTDELVQVSTFTLGKVDGHLDIVNTERKPTTKLDSSSYPVSLRLSPYIGRTELIKFINAHWKEIRFALDRYGDEIDFRKQKNEEITEYVMQLKLQGKSVGSIFRTCKSMWPEQIEHRKDVELLIRTAEDQILAARQIRIKRDS